MAAGHFRYKLDKMESRIIPGKYGLVAQVGLLIIRKIVAGHKITCFYVMKCVEMATCIIDPLHVHGNAADQEDRTIRFFNMRIDLNSQKRKFLLFCPPDYWLHSHDVQGVYSIVCDHLLLFVLTVLTLLFLYFLS